MVQSHIIDIDGVFVGAAIRIDRGYRFVATASIWPSLTDVQRVARRVYRDATSAGPLTPSLHARAHLTAIKGR